MSVAHHGAPISWSPSFSLLTPCLVPHPNSILRPSRQRESYIHKVLNEVLNVDEKIIYYTDEL